MTDYTDEEARLTDTFCPVCGCPLVEEYGLLVCYYCGYSPEEENDVNI